MILAFSGLPNTGKSTEISRIADRYDTQSVYKEVARQLFHCLPDQTLFQKMIKDAEDVRVRDLRREKKEKGLVLVDRTYYDNVIFNSYNYMKGDSKLEPRQEQTTKDLYDVIILFSKPFKENGRFSSYNDPAFQKMFIEEIHKEYGRKVLEYENAGDPHYQEFMTYLLSHFENKGK